MRRAGRYVLFDKLAAGGQAVVHLGRLSAPHGFARTVAIKCLHPGFASDPELVALFLDEARLAARIRHPNVVPIIDVVAEDGEVMFITGLRRGESLSEACAPAAKSLEPGLATTIPADALRGLHAAHEARGEDGTFLALVHRDVSPQNIIVGVDGVSRVLDFGIAKALGRTQHTSEGQIRGKVSYIIARTAAGRSHRPANGRFQAGVVLWEGILVGKPLLRRTTTRTSPRCAC